ncbi:MAG: PadR family transcriptional regulator [Saprospiraceae bacterium]
MAQNAAKQCCMLLLPTVAIKNKKTYIAYNTKQYSLYKVCKIKQNMKRTYLGEFEEIVLLVILILEKDAYGVSIKDEIHKRLGRKISRGALHTSLSRLEKKGFIRSDFGEATPVRGGRRKKYYQLTQNGKISLNEIKNVRAALWQAVPQFKLGFS